MRCPKCGYQSFNNLATCKKCGMDLSREQARFKLGVRMLASSPASAPEISDSAAGEEQDRQLEDYFLSIEDLETDHVPTGPPTKIAENKDREHSPQAADSLQWSGNIPEDSIPFDAIDTDLEALRGESFEEQESAPAGSGPFDMEWPMSEEEVAGEIRPVETPVETSVETPVETSVETPVETSVETPVETPTATENVTLLENDEQQPDPSATAAATDEPFPAPNENVFEWPEVLPPLPLEDEDGSQAGKRDNLLSWRVLACCFDVGLLSGAFLLFVAAGEIVRVPEAAQRFRFSGDILLELATPYFLVLFALCFGYFTLFHYLTGQTPGKMLLGLRVEADDRSDLPLSRAFLRSVGGLAALLPLGMGILSILFNSEQRGWNDRLAGTRVVLQETSEHNPDPATTPAATMTEQAGD